jgi:O-acetyl-ADP-ribose deacetylase (regulator of RNase III)
MPSVAIVPNTFAVGGFSRDSILPAFIRMFNQYHFTNDEFLTDVRFLASNEEGIQNLCSILGLSGPSSKNRSPQVNISARFNKEGSPAATLVTGDISSIVADVIVVPVNPSLDLRGETSKAVNMASGKALSKSLSSLKGKLSEGMISPVSCDQWDIPAKYLLLLCRSPSTRMDVLKKGCRKALDTAKSLGLRSIAFPPITSHQGKEELAKAMVEVFKSFQDGDQNQMSIMVVLKKNDSNQASFKSILDRHYWESKV